ncbi:MAG: FixH family protein [Rhizobiaceae bacterium]
MTRFRVLFMLLALAALGFGAFVAYRMMQPPPDDLDLSRLKASQAGMFMVGIEPEGGALVQGPLHAWVASVSLADGTAVEGATIAVDGGMPQHGHGLPTAPKVTADLGGGRYRIEGVRFNMGGWWVFRLAIEADGKSDTVEFNLVL